MLRASRNPSFRIPRPQRDRVDLRQLAAIAGACLSVGVALSGLLHSAHRGLHELHDDMDYDWQEASAAAPLHALLPSEGSLETSISAATTQPPAAAADSSMRAEPAKPTLQRGAVTYDCAGAVNDRAAAKSSKCPRDRALEARVWRVLSRLSTCRENANALGRAKLHLRFAPDAATTASFSAPTIAPSLNLRAVSKCVAGELSKLRSTRKVDRFELEIGFGLTGRN